MSGVELTPVCTVWARQSPDAPTTPRDWVSNSPQRRWESGGACAPSRGQEPWAAPSPTATSGARSFLGLGPSPPL